jgi:inhibitor of KinA
MTDQPRPRYLASGDTALVVEFDERIDRAVNNRVLALAMALEQARIAGVCEAVPTFRSLMVHYDPVATSFTDLKRRIDVLLVGLTSAGEGGRHWALPACYEDELAPDLDEVAKRTGLTPAHVVELHAGQFFHVYMIGFLPGFPYMGDLPEALALPRRENPRTRVPAGSVCIAMTMAGVYPLESPGGWHLLGRTPVRLFDARRKGAVLLAPGDKVRFKPISAREFRKIDSLAQAGKLVIEPEATAA